MGISRGVSEFAMKKNESVAEMFNRLNDIVNELKGLKCQMWISHKFFRNLPMTQL